MVASKVQEFVSEQRQAIAERVERLRTQPVASARDTAIRSAQRLKALKEPVRDVARSGVRLTSISQNTAQSLIELLGEVLTSALTGTAARLERAARSGSLVDLVRSRDAGRSVARDRIIGDLRQAVGILRIAGGDIRKVATQTYAKISDQGGAVTEAKRPARARKRRTPARSKARRARRAA